MSTRYMKKVFGGDEIVDGNKENVSDVENSVNDNFKSKSFNVFDVLNDNSSSESETIDEKNDETNSDVVKGKKKKKKRRKPEIGKMQQQTRKPESEEEIDEIESLVKEVNQLLGEPSPSSSKENSEKPQWIVGKSKESILSVRYKHLNPFNELMRIFGRKTIQAEQSKRRNRGRTGYLKRNWLVSPRENWPLIGKSGLSMSVDSTMKSDNVLYFVYEHDSSYKQIEYKFLEAVESSNPESLINVINTHTYHVDTLLQLAELCKLSEDLPMAVDFTERALYSLECAFHPLFNVETARCRLDYRKQINRALFITIFKHLTFVGGRACYRTSLEFCKLLLSLDPLQDPLAVVLFIDFYALRAREYKWFVDFCNLWDSTRNLTQLPNIAYSLALSHFCLGNHETANELLQNALIMFPGVLIPLLEKCSVQTDSKVTAHYFFNSKAKNMTTLALEKLQNLYIVRSYHLWTEADVLPWLEKCVHLVLDRVDSKDSYVKYCEVKRGERYKGNLPTNILRHIILADIKEITVNVQEIQDAAPVLLYDPLPPANSVDTYGRPTASQRGNLSNWGLFSLFFSSLFGNIDVAFEEVAEVAEGLAANGFNLFDQNDDRA
ncbi:PREDICTED: transcription factor 25 [Polistes canadensis]|uniref:transcription factor 25 n=1 Tax=Polistes canadensis TaxID=91411 RepID=UPI000718F451|nr:PREDICTED: transcription factor 25 [Polistes canadensis]XP_014616086.1 PREDICTED: transcription factor 25 [Polistes canadensis]XP_014616087.1 PREDICTED: transcription factor 25 [Polistes canadensis]